MKKTKKNNKGFSLVELIVVVLIMAIIAVALAPQVMKWVGNSRTSTDLATYNTMKSNVELALANEAVMAYVKGAPSDITVKITKGANPTISVAAGNAFYDALDDICEINSFQFKDSTSGTATITVKKGTGKLEGDATFEAKADTVS